MRLRQAASIFVVCLSLATGVWTSQARADFLDQAWKRGNEAHLRGDYAGAAAAYQQLDKQRVVSADLYYNLGVTYFRQGHLGHAIWAFERALVVAPDDEDARFNLTQARKLGTQRAHDKLEGAEREPLWSRVVAFFSPATEVWMFCGLYLGCFALLFIRRRMTEGSRLAISTAAAVLGSAALLAGALLLGRMDLDRIPHAIVLPDTVAVKEGADAGLRTSFEVHGGLRVRVVDRDQDWVRVRLANGLEGFVHAEDLGTL